MDPGMDERTVRPPAARAAACTSAARSSSPTASGTTCWSSGVPRSRPASWRPARRTARPPVVLASERRASHQARQAVDLTGLAWVQQTASAMRAPSSSSRPRRSRKPAVRAAEASRLRSTGRGDCMRTGLEDMRAAQAGAAPLVDARLATGPRRSAARLLGGDEPGRLRRRGPALAGTSGCCPGLAAALARQRPRAASRSATALRPPHALAPRARALT